VTPEHYYWWKVRLSMPVGDKPEESGKLEGFELTGLLGFVADRHGEPDFPPVVVLGRHSKLH